jgi:hypothetical protein
LAKRAEILCEYQPYIDQAPVAPTSLYKQACSNDQRTVEHWRETWLTNVKANKERFGSFKDHGLGRLFDKHRGLPSILAGSGPSLRQNAELLKARGNIPLVSCLHNFHFLEDTGVPADYYVSLDAGPVTIEEVSEGGQKTPDEYWALTKDRTLLCFTGTDPKLLELWQGAVYFFSCPIPDEKLSLEMDEVEPFHSFVSTGGNVLGACLYIAKSYLGSQVSIFVGADFSFSYLDKFHGWDSKYDKSIGQCLRVTDVYGHSVKTWPSYHNFKCWFDWVTQSVPGVYFNCTEGGTFGAYPGGNLRSLIQMDLKDCLRMFSISEEIRDQAENPDTAMRKILF